MNNEQRKFLSRNAKAMLNYSMTGRLPQVSQQTSPLITYLESKQPRERMNMVGVRLHPSLGYNCVVQFPNAQLMLNYLKPPASVNGQCPAASYKLVSFRNVITDKIFAEAQQRSSK